MGLGDRSRSARGLFVDYVVTIYQPTAETYCSGVEKVDPDSKITDLRPFRHPV